MRVIFSRLLYNREVETGVNVGGAAPQEAAVPSVKICPKSLSNVHCVFIFFC